MPYKTKTLLKDALPVRLWDDQDAAWKNVAAGISNEIEELKGDRLS
ncbi:hypothetical protein [Altericista sp. CCNU0014]